MHGTDSSSFALRLLLLLWRPALPDTQRMDGLHFVLQSAIDLHCKEQRLVSVSNAAGVHHAPAGKLIKPHQAVPLQELLPFELAAHHCNLKARSTPMTSSSLEPCKVAGGVQEIIRR